MSIPWVGNLLAHGTAVIILITAVSSSPSASRQSRSTTTKLLSIETQFNSSPDAGVLSPRGEFELSYNTFAALGDSYASGLGAGRVLDRRCHRYDNSYPYLINTDPRLGNQDVAGRRFESLACAGATTRDIVYKQIPQLTTEIDIMTLTAGGNDVGFGKIVDTCVFGIGRSPCERLLEAGRRYIYNILPQSLDWLLRVASSKLTPHTGRIFITGYAKFFNADTTQCDSVSVSLFGRKKPLDQYHRQNYNDLIALVNLEISLAAERAGPQVVFVNYDPYFTQCGGRLCELGVREPDVNRPKLLFFERGGHDVALPDSDTGIKALVGRRIEKLASLFSFPDSDLRIFHPRSNGQKIIADVVLACMQEDRAKSMGFTPAPLKDDICPP